jgi:hypothetical protein
MSGVTLARDFQASRDFGELRKIPLIIALALVVVCVLIELGAAFFLEGGNDTPPGLGIPYLALVDGILAYSLALMVLALVFPENIQAKLQGILSVILSFFLALGSIVLIFVALAKLLLMVGLFFAVPFGTIAYFAGFGNFAKGAAAATLSLILLLKIIACICLPIAHQRFLNDKGLIFLVLTALVAVIVVSFLHGLVPGPLVSITDAVAAIIVGILALIWAIVILIGSIIAVVQALTTSV